MVHICNINIIYIHKNFRQLHKITKKNRNQTFVKEMKNVSDGPISRLSTAMKRINELEPMSIEISRPEMQINL